MIDDELLQELLGKASGLYNNGEYRSAIEAWKEALKVDPGSQKAREGIQMATLLLAGSDPGVEEAETPEPAPPADGARESIEGLSREEIDHLLDQGISRVRALLNERKYSEAVEGARLLVPMDPDSEEVQRLVEDAQQAFEAAPFIEEHLMLARELASQERYEEAETECRKVFALDRTNPDAHTLIADLRRRARGEGQGTPSKAASPDVGGRTVRMDFSQMLGKAPELENADLAGLRSEDVAPEPLAPAAPAGPEAGARAAQREPVADALAVDTFDFDLDLGGTGPGTAAPVGAGSTPSERGEETEAAPEPTLPAEAPGDGDVPFVDAETVVPPSVRLVPRSEEAATSAESWLEGLQEGSPAAPAPADAARGARSEADPPGDPSVEPSDWERELENLNLKTGEHDILGRNAARAPAVPSPEIDSDLTSLLQDEIASQPPAGGPLASGPGDERVEEARPETVKPREEGLGEAPRVRQRLEEGARVATQTRRARREVVEVPPAVGNAGRSVSFYFGLLGVVLLAAGGTVWWFFFQPKTAAGSMPSAVTPPSASSGEKPVADPGPIPTPIGSTSKDAVKPPPSGSHEAAAPTGEGTSEAARGQALPKAGEPVPNAPPSPPPRPKSPEELRSEVARHMSEGRRLLAASQWRGARDQFAAVIALDPVNFEGKELLDQAQEHVNQETKVLGELAEAKSAFEEKNYQTALWKLYRLPRDARLGDNDLHIRNAWFNWAVLCLKNGDASNASQKLAEVLSADPGDPEAEKLQDVATRYSAKAKDKLYYAFVDTLKYRSFDQR